MGDLPCFISRLTPAARQDFWLDKGLIAAYLGQNPAIKLATRVLDQATRVIATAHLHWT